MAKFSTIFGKKNVPGTFMSCVTSTGKLVFFGIFKLARSGRRFSSTVGTGLTRRALSPKISDKDSKQYIDISVNCYKGVRLIFASLFYVLFTIIYSWLIKNHFKGCLVSFCSIILGVFGKHLSHLKSYDWPVGRNGCHYEIFKTLFFSELSSFYLQFLPILKDFLKFPCVLTLPAD